MAKKPRLGRGLSSLVAMPVPVEPPAVDVEARPKPRVASPDSVADWLSEQSSPPAAHASDHPADAPPSSIGAGLVWLSVELIEPNPYQPRRQFDEAGLDQLASSIRQDGVMQPIVVRPAPRQGGDEQGDDGALAGYQLVAGERRWRAAKLAELQRIPAIVRELDDQQIAEWAVIENLQREDLNAMDRAEAFASLAERFELKHDQIADRIGVDRTTVTNLIRLLGLHADIQGLIRCGQLSAGHGRALLAVTDGELAVALAQKAVAGGWSVRAVEEAVRRAVASTGKKATRKAGRSKHLADLERQITTQIGLRTRIRAGRKKNTGTLMIDYEGIETFDELMKKLGVEVD